MRKVLVVGARAFAGLAPRSARVGGPADQASCVAQFVNAFPPGAVGPFASRMAQNPALHPFGEMPSACRRRRRGTPARSHRQASSRDGIASSVFVLGERN
jgi:hypothetical protein